jgi:hypothetical protein
MGLKLNATNGGGSVELDVPDTVNSDLALTVPAAAGTIDRLERAGNILQVKNKIFTGDDEFSSNSFVDVTNFSQTLATSSSSNKVLIILNITLYTNTTTNAASARITYDGNSTREIQRQYTSASGIPGTISFMSLVSPGKTDSITYQVQVKSDFASHTYNLNKDFNGDNTSHSELILMEVAA